MKFEWNLNNIRREWNYNEINTIFIQKNKNKIKKLTKSFRIPYLNITKFVAFSLMSHFSKSLNFVKFSLK